MPVESGEGKQPFRHAARVLHVGIVVGIEDAVPEQAAPVRHQSAVLSVMMGDVGEVRGIAQSVVELLEPDRERRVARIAHGVHEAGVREHGLQHAEQAERIRALVGHDVGAREPALEVLQVALGERLPVARVERERHPQEPVDLAAGRDPRMRGEHLLE